MTSKIMTPGKLKTERQFLLIYSNKRYSQTLILFASLEKIYTHGFQTTIKINLADYVISDYVIPLCNNNSNKIANFK